MPPDATSTSPDPRRRKALYRACHRGTKEMDWLLGRFAEARIPGMSDDELDVFEQVLALTDPDLQGMLMTGKTDAASAFAPTIAAIRSFHGLEN